MSTAPYLSEQDKADLATLREPLAVLEFARQTPGRENEMPRVISCNWLPDGLYEVYAAARIEALEAALRQIADPENWGGDGTWSSDSYPDEIARAALKQD